MRLSKFDILLLLCLCAGCASSDTVDEIKTLKASIASLREEAKAARPEDEATRIRIDGDLRALETRLAFFENRAKNERADSVLSFTAPMEDIPKYGVLIAIAGRLLAAFLAGKPEKKEPTNGAV